MASETNHPWCRDVQRDEAVRAAEDAAAVPAIQHRDLPEQVALLWASVGDLIGRVVRLEGEMDAGQDEEAAPAVCDSASPAEGLRTERVTLEVTQRVEDYVAPSRWNWCGQLGSHAQPGESVRVVEAATIGTGDVFADVQCGSTADEIARLTAERDAARAESERLRAAGDAMAEALTWDQSCAYDAATTRGAIRQRIAAWSEARACVAELEGAAVPAANAGGESPPPRGWLTAEERDAVVANTCGDGDCGPARSGQKSGQNDGLRTERVTPPWQRAKWDEALAIICDGGDWGRGNNFDHGVLGALVIWADKEMDRLAAERDAAIRERDQAVDDGETLRMSLTACDVIANSNTSQSLSCNRIIHPNYDCEAVQSVIRAVEREIALRDRVSELERERDAAVQEREYACRAAESLREQPAEIALLTAERDLARAVRDGLRSQRDAARAERDAAIRERDEAREERALLLLGFAPTHWMPRAAPPSEGEVEG